VPRVFPGARRATGREPAGSLVPGRATDGDVLAQLTYLVDRLDHLSPYLPAELLPRLVTGPGQVRIVPSAAW